MSGERYYYRDGQKNIGPLSRTLILKLYANRRVRRNTVARLESGSDWVTLDNLVPDEELQAIDQKYQGKNGRALFCLLWCVIAWFAWVGFDPVQLSLARFLYWGVLLALTGVFIGVAAGYARGVFGEVHNSFLKYLSRAFCVLNLLVAALYVFMGGFLFWLTANAFSWGHHHQWDFITGERLAAHSTPIADVQSLPWDLSLAPERPVALVDKAVGASSPSTIVLQRTINFDEPYDWRSIPVNNREDAGDE